MSAESVALDHYRDRAALAEAVSALAARVWRQVDPGNLDASWQRLGPQLLVGVAGAQLAAARMADPYADRELKAQGSRTGSDYTVVADALAGIASDGRPLDSLLQNAILTVKGSIARGATIERAMAGGLANLDMLARTQVADAGRAADSVAIATRPQVAGYRRMLVGKSCSRCVILAGRWYRWNAGFNRHPRCDCIHVPAAESLDDVTTNPRTYFDSLTAAEQDKTFTKAGAAAIREGADMGRVVNARRGMHEAGGKLLTTEAAGKRPRLMPEQIFKQAKDRDDAIRLLRSNGYLRPVRKAATTPRPPAPTFDQRVAAASTGTPALKSVPAGLGRGSDVKLTRPQVRALRDYESAYFQAINGQLRNDAVTSGVARTVGHIDTVMGLSQLPGDVQVWRGVTNSERLFGARLDGNLTGMVWREDAYTSTSAADKVARDFTRDGGDRPVVMRILAPAGTPAVRISGSGYGEQAEILLGRGLRFRVVADRGTDPSGIRHIDVEVLRG